MNSYQTSRNDAQQLKIASLVVPVIITCLVPILFFSALSLHQLVGSGIILAVVLLSLIVGNMKDKDIAIIWVAAILYNLYLLAAVFL